MAELPAELAEAVNQQAQARVEMNIQGYARFLTPEAIDSLRASFPGVPPRVSGYEVANVDQSGSDYAVDIRYSNREASFIALEVAEAGRGVDGGARGAAVGRGREAAGIPLEGGGERSADAGGAAAP
jgi:hypothetical protein